jgi:hypothetical protein
MPELQIFDHLHDLSELDVDEMDCVIGEYRRWSYETDIREGSIWQLDPEGRRRTVQVQEGCDIPVRFLAGRSVTYHSDTRVPIVLFGETVTLRLTIDCQYGCGCGHVVYARSGLHSGAWCYANDEAGQFVNLRDQSYVCHDPRHDCQSKIRA